MEPGPTPPVEPDWASAPPFGRRGSLLHALRRLFALHPGPACIVETGTLRDDDSHARDGDGWSTIAFGWYAQQTGGRLFTVDTDPAALATCQRLTASYAAHIEYVQADSLAFLAQWAAEGRPPIDLLYLDSLDYHEPERSEQHQLAEAQAILPALAPTCLVLLDDTHPVEPPAPDGITPLRGKGRQAAPFLVAQGFRLEICAGGQVLLSRGPATLSPSHRVTLSSLTSLPPLCEVERHFAASCRAPYVAEYLAAVLSLARRGRTCEIGVGLGYGPIWLSRQGVAAEGIGEDARIVERARHVNSFLHGRAAFRVGDPLTSVATGTPEDHIAVLHHQGLLEHFPAHQVHAILAQQAAMADWVVFSIPSVYYPFVHEARDERLLPLEVWQHLLHGFDVADLRYYGDPQLGGREHILGVLRGTADRTPDSSFILHPSSFPFGISVIVHTRNEARRLAECLQTVPGWTDEIIVCDMESTDETVEIARRFGAQIVHHPLIRNFDRARNVSAMRARYRWILYLDADERVPPGLGPVLRDLLAREGDHFESVVLPFRHYFAGRWLSCLHPGYKAPSLYKNGCFFYHDRPHAGAHVEGRTILFSGENPEQALVHDSYDSLAHYLEKMNRYTETEAANMRRDGRTFHWQQLLRHMVSDWKMYYDVAGAHRDGPHGFLYALNSAFYRAQQHGKLFEQRFRAGEIQPHEETLPGSLEEILEYALAVVRERPMDARPESRVTDNPERQTANDKQETADVVWSGPLYSASGYGEESRQFLFALEDASVAVAAHVRPWGRDDIALTEEERVRLQVRVQQPLAPGFVQIVQDLAPNFDRHPDASVVIGRTMFETDRLPDDWVRACNRMDYVWVPTEFNRRTFAQAGVAEEKLVVMPGCLDAALYTTERADADRATDRPFTFLSVFDWTRHKGWDVLLRAFLEAFEGRDDVALVLKVWSSYGDSAEAIREQAATFVRRVMNCDLLSDPRVRFFEERLVPSDLRALYRDCDAFVLPSRGEGWGRPYMEAMACGLPTIGTNWSGNSAFMTPENSYLVDATVVPVAEAGWREVAVYRGHRWAEPDREHLKAQMRRVFEAREEAREVGRRGREYVLTHFRREAVGRLMAEEIARVRERGRSTDRFAAICTSPPSSPALQAGSETELRSPRPSREKGDVSAPQPFSPRPSGGRGQGVRGEQPGQSTSIRVRWEGAQLVWHSLAHVNRELCAGLLQSGKVELSLVPTQASEFEADEDARFPALEERVFAPLSGPADVHVRHHFPTRLEPPPDEGRFVLMQAWEFGFLPADWIEPIRRHVHEVWCHSRYIRDIYIASGIPEERLHIIPHGIDPRVFHPDAPPYVFTTEAGVARAARHARAPFIFLFVGGTVHRKGIDIVVDAYLRAFAPREPVCLVIKDTCTRTAYRGMNQKEHLLALANDPSRPSVVYLDDDLPTHKLAGLYTTAHCLAQPYRGEAFCLPVLEAMACGLPVIVPEGGPTDDYVDETVGWRVPAERRPMGGNRVGEWECAGPAWMLEVSPDVLAEQMRQVYENREEAARRGQAGAVRAREGWTWEHAVGRVQARLDALREDARRPVPPPPPPKQGKRGRNRDKDAPTGRPSKGEGPPPSQARRPTITLCMIVKNEERVLAACLQSARPWFDEIIVVDTGSTDRTVEIAEAHGAKVYHFPWTDSFAEARNESLRHATGEWIFWMDADDTLPFRSGEAIRQAAETAPEEVVGFIVPVQFVDEGSPVAGTRVDHVKLFRNLPGLAFEGRIHEQILRPLRATGRAIVRCDALVLHSGYDTSPEGQARKRARDEHLLDLSRKEQPDDSFILFCSGMTDHYAGEHEKAVAWLRRCLEVADPGESQVRKTYALLAISLRELGRTEECLQTLDEGLAVAPGDPELHFRAGYILMEIGRHAEARAHYLKVLEADISDHFSSVDVGILGFKTYHNLGALGLTMGDYAEARTWWLKAIEAAPEFLPSAFELFNAALVARDRATAQAMLDRVRAKEGESANWATMQARLLEVTGEDTDAEAMLRRAIRLDASATEPRLLLVRRLLNAGRELEAREHLVMLDGAGVAEATFYLGVAAIRGGRLQEALHWMERAQSLNPEHAETREQVASLRRALGQTDA